MNCIEPGETAGMNRMRFPDAAEEQPMVDVHAHSQASCGGMGQDELRFDTNGTTLGRLAG